MRTLRFVARWRPWAPLIDIAFAFVLVGLCYLAVDVLIYLLDQLRRFM